MRRDSYRHALQKLKPHGLSHSECHELAAMVSREQASYVVKQQTPSFDLLLLPSSIGIALFSQQSGLMMPLWG